MAWTAPMTFVAGTALTAAQLNTYLRDNLMETAAAKATQSSSIFVGNGPNQIVERAIQQTYITTSETTTSTSYADLATVGPVITTTTGTSAMVFISSRMSNAAAGAPSCTYMVSGASTIAAAASQGMVLAVDGIAAGQSVNYTKVHFINSLTPGSNTFTMQYASSASTSTFSYRQLCVIPL
jgi:hypothetical protein